MLVHVIRLANEAITVNGRNILAFDTGIDWDVTRVNGGAAGMRTAVGQSKFGDEPRMSRLRELPARGGWERRQV